MLCNVCRQCYATSVGELQIDIIRYKDRVTDLENWANYVYRNADISLIDKCYLVKLKRIGNTVFYSDSFDALLMGSIAYIYDDPDFYKLYFHVLIAVKFV